VRSALGRSTETRTALSKDRARRSGRPPRGE